MNMNPSTFAQVRENMRNIQEILIGDESDLSKLIEKVDQIQNTLDTIMNPPSGSGDVVPDNDGNLQVYGITIMTQFADTDVLPAAYTRDVTYELKRPSAVGLQDLEEFSAGYILMATFKRNMVAGETVDIFGYNSQQIAYGKSMVGYTRTAIDNNSRWGAWEGQPSGGRGAGGQWVESVTEPEDQEPGDYWCEPLG